MNNIKKYIVDQVTKKNLNPSQAALFLQELQSNEVAKKNKDKEDIAVIGMACRFPDADNIQQYWENIINGVCSIGKYPESRRKNTDSYLSDELRAKEDPYQTQGFISEIDKFDHNLFNITPAEANEMDPCQRLLLMTIWEAIEEAGLGGGKLRGSSTGVFVGKAHLGEPMYKEFIEDKDEHAFTGSVSGILSSRISYILDLKGPSMVIDTACSSGMVAIHTACQSLKNGECDQVIAGGISLSLFPTEETSVSMLESPNHQLRIFDKASNGTVWGEGVGALVLKPLKKAIMDNDNIYAVIKGGAINNDGASNGITAPSPEAQEQLLLKAWGNSNIDPETISYIETHGTGTALGDPIEIKGLTNAFKKYTNKSQFCAIGGVKPNIGHLIAASGIASIIKVILALKNRKIPPTIKFDLPSQYVNFCNSPVYMNDRLIDWEKDKSPRRAGVSSFGLSGTNCHVILEEAPLIENESSAVSKSEILVLSARTEEVLKSLVLSYSKYLHNSEMCDVRDVCYTQATGRGHYNFRLALIVRNNKDLIDKIDKLAALDKFTALSEDEIFYNEHNVVTSIKRVTSDRDITEDYRREITKLSISKINEYMDKSKDDTGIMKEICGLYIKGAVIDWESLYRNEKRRKVNIPLYPFENKKCWTKAKKIKKPEETLKPIHKLVEKKSVESLFGDVYTSIFDADKFWFLDQHKILDNSVIPGTAFVEMAVAIGKTYFGEGIELKDVTLLMPAVFKEGEKKEVQVIVKKEKDYLDFTIAGRTTGEILNENDSWTQYAVGKVLKCIEASEKVDMESIKTSFGSESKLIDPEQLSRGLIKFGERWKNSCWFSGASEKGLAEIEILSAFKEDMEDFNLHPALLDLGFNAAAFINGENYLPFSYGSIKLYDKMPLKFYSYLIKNNASDDKETIGFDIVMADLDGHVFAKIENYNLKKAAGIEKLFVSKDKYSRRIWKKKRSEAHQSEFKTVLIINDKSSEAKYPQDFFEKFEEMAERLFVVDINSDSTLNLKDKNSTLLSRAVFEDIFEKININEISHIIKLSTCEHSWNNKTESEIFETSLNNSIYNLFGLAKAVVSKNMDKGFELVIVSHCTSSITGKEKEINPFGAGLFNLGRTLSRENNKISCKCIDVDEFTTLDCVIEELNSDNFSCITAFRDGERYEDEFEIIDIGSMDEENVEIRKDGVYVITGGTGGLGLEVAKHFARSNNVRIALVSRSEIPQRALWDNILKDDGNKKSRKVISTIKEIEDLGSKVECFAGDMSRVQDVEAVLNKVRNVFGKINGIIHSAGVAGNSFIEKESYETFSSVISPKILGTYFLDTNSKNDELDFFIMFSSIAGIIGIPGQGDYSCANAFMDSYASMRSRHGKTISINWPSWKEVGMAVDHKANIDSVFKSISTYDALDAFNTSLNRKVSNIIIGEWNYGADELIEQLSLSLSSDIENKIKNEKERALRKNSILERERNNSEDRPIQIKGKDKGNYTPTEIKVATIWANTLGYDEINIFDNFYDLGGDSILAVKLLNRINKSFETSINISEVFNYLTVAEFSSLIDSKNSSAKAIETKSSTIISVEKSDYYPASSQQQRLYVIHQLTPDGTSYNLPGFFEIRGQLNTAQIKFAVNKLIERHEALRTYFEFQDGVLVQKILENVKFDIVEKEADEDQILNLCKDFIKPFDLDNAPILRIMLLKISEQRHIIGFDIHHIIADGSSVAVFIKDFIAIYNNVNLPELVVQYKDYASFQKKNSESEGVKKQEEFWMEALKGELPVLNMPLDYKRPSLQSFEGNRVEFSLDGDVTAKLKGLAADRNVTVFMIMLAAYNVMLSKYSSQQDIIVGVPAFGRNYAELEGVMGMFVNTLPMRNYPSSDKSFSEFLSDVKINVLKAFDNQEFRLEEIIRKLEIERDKSRNPIFDTTFVFQNLDKDIEITNFGIPKINIQLDNLNFSTFDFEHNITQFDLTMEAIERDSGITCFLVYCSKLFKPETIERMAGHFANIVHKIVENPDISIEAIELITEEEKRVILQKFNNTKADYPKELMLQDVFERQVNETPKNIAAIFEDKEITYEQLNLRANQLAHRLRNEGVTKDVIVGVMLYRSIDMITSIMAVLKAGGAYMPISPDYPKDRIEFMLSDSKSPVLLTQGVIGEHIEFEGKILNVENKELYEGAVTNPQKVNNSCDLAYVIYTSGSTGKPKGAMIEHYSVINRINWMQKMYPISPKDTILQKTPYTFDVSVWELFWWSFTGAKVCFLEPGGEKYPESIISAVERYNITTMHFVPSMLNIFMQYVEGINEEYRLKSLRQVFASGEALGLHHVMKFNTLLAEKFGTRLHNLYGPTEATVDVSYFDCKDAVLYDQVPIGKPIDNIKLYVLNSKNKLQPVGVPGELFISGDGVGRGYINRPELTSEKFLQDPFESGIRMYRTGDVARWLPDGNIEYLGRMDYQVKIRGFRIELGEIETEILKHGNVIEAVVIDRLDQQNSRYLCAYVVCSDELDVEALKARLNKSLADYMVPSYFVKIDKIPLSQNGKVDRKALPEPQADIQIKSFEGPRNYIEEKLVEVWQEVLGVKNVGIRDNFFTLGGDSIKAIQVMIKLQEHGLKLMVKELFEHPEIGQLSNFVKESVSQVDQRPIVGEVLLTPIQKWFFENYQDRNHFNQSFLLYRKEGFDGEIVKAVLSKILQHHDGLRMTYKMLDGEIKQYNRDIENVEFSFSTVNLTQNSDYVNAIYEECEKISPTMNIESGNLVKAISFDTENGGYLLLEIHHLVVDGISWRIILEDFEAGYKAQLQNRDVQFKPKTHSYQQWALELNEYAQRKAVKKELNYWNELLKKPVKPLPKDYSTENNQYKFSNSIELLFTEEETEQILKTSNRTYNTEAYDILLVALGLAVKEHFGNDQVLVNLEGHGREDIIEGININRTVGWFTSIYPVVLDMTYTSDMSYQIRHIKESLRKIPNKGIGYGVLRYLTDLDKEDSSYLNVNSDICFNYLGQFDNGLKDGLFEISGLSRGLCVSEQSKRSYAVEINAVVLNNRLQVAFNYCTNEYSENTIIGFVDMFKSSIYKVVSHCISIKDVQRTPSDYGNTGIKMEELEHILETVDGQIDKIYPLSPMQEGMLFQTIINKGKGFYFEQFAFNMNGELNVEIFEKSYNEVLKRHDIFRTVFITDGLERPQQVVVKDKQAKVIYEDISMKDREDIKNYLETFRYEDRKKEFDVTCDILFRLAVFKTSENTYSTVWSFHHLVMDGWCLSIILKEVLSIYKMLLHQKTIELDPSKSYSKYIEWLQKQDDQETMEYWKNYLEGYETPTSPNKTFGAGQVKEYIQQQIQFEIDPSLNSKLVKMANTKNITMNNIFQTIWAILLQRYNNVNDVVFGSVVSGRPPEVEGIDRMVGLFINTIPLRVTTESEDTFLSVVQKVRDSGALAQRHSYYPLYKLQKLTLLSQNLFDNILVFENYPIEEEFSFSMDKQNFFGFTLDEYEIYEQTNFDFNFKVIPGEKIVVILKYNSNVYSEENVSKIEKHFTGILEQVVENPEIGISEIEMISSEQEMLVLSDFNDDL